MRCAKNPDAMNRSFGREFCLLFFTVHTIKIWRRYQSNKIVENEFPYIECNMYFFKTKDGRPTGPTVGRIADLYLIDVFLVFL